MSAPISPLSLLLAVGSLCGVAAANDVVTSFEFTDLSGQFTLGTPPNQATFTNGQAKSVMMFGLYHTGFNSWMVDEGDLGVVTFSTPAESVDFWFRDQLFVGSTLTVLDVNGNAIDTIVGSAVWQHVVEGSAAIPVGSITLQNVVGNGYAVIDDFTYCALPPLGNQYCGPGVPNSSGASAVITADGSKSVVVNDVTLTAAQLPVGQFGFFLTSQTQGFFNPPGSNGFICLGGAIGRFNQPQNIGQGPTFSIQVDLTAVPRPTGPVAVQPGDTWNFQAWYRDVGNTNNFTDAVSVTFQ